MGLRGQPAPADRGRRIALRTSEHSRRLAQKLAQEDLFCSAPALRSSNSTTKPTMRRFLRRGPAATLGLTVRDGAVRGNAAPHLLFAHVHTCHARDHARFGRHRGVDRLGFRRLAKRSDST